MTGVVERLARVPLVGVGLAIVVSAILMAVHVLLVQHTHATGAAEPPQWVGRLLGLYWVLLPLGFMALWARRRREVGIIGRIGAVMLACGPVSAVVLLVAAAIWGGFLGRGDLPAGFMVVESLTLVMMLGVLVSGVALLRVSGARWWGAAMIIALAANFVMSVGAAAALAVFGALLFAAGARSNVRATSLALEAAD